MVTPFVKPDTVNVEDLGVWRDRTYQLRFYVGEFHIGTFRLRAKVVEDVYFDCLSQDWANRRLPLEALQGRADVLYLPSVPIDKKLPRLSLSQGALRYVPAQYARYYVDVRAGFSEYLQKFSSKRRRELMRQVRKFERDGGGAINWREFRRAEEMSEFHSTAREISQKTYQERLLKKGLPSDPAYWQQLEALARDNRVRAYILYFGGTPAAFHLCTVHGGTLVGEYIGYDPQLGRYSPGSIEQYLLIEKMFGDQQFDRFDFGEGGSAYKEFFATGSVLCADVFYYRCTVRSLLLLVVHSAIAGLSSLPAKLLEHLKLKARLKNFVRFRVGRQLCLL